MTKRRGEYLLAGLICLVLCFIWGNSMLSGEESSAVSGGMLGWLTGTFPFLKWLPENLLRKFGHFSEFSCWAFCLPGFSCSRASGGCTGCLYPCCWA